MELTPRRVHEGTLGKYLLLQPSRHVGPSLLISFSYTAFMFESSMQVTITDYGMKRTGKLHGRPSSFDYGLLGRFLTSSFCRARAEDV